MLYFKDSTLIGSYLNMKLLFDFFPIVLFFIGFKLFNIYVATAIAMLASSLQVLYFRLRHQRYEKMHVINFFIILISGSATLFFHNPLFIKWKPTAIYWITAMVFLLSPYFSKKSLIQRTLEPNIALPDKIWQKLNVAWSVFFIFIGILNLYVAYYFSTNSWVNFKLFGCLGLIIVFVCVQALYLTKHMHKNVFKEVQSK